MKTETDMKLSKREKILMSHAWGVSKSGNYESIDDWLRTAAGDTGYMVEEYLALEFSKAWVE